MSGPVRTRDPAEVDLIVRIEGGPEPRALVGENDRRPAEAPLYLPRFDLVDESHHFRSAMLSRARADATREVGLANEDASREIVRSIRTLKAAPTARSAEELGSAMFDALFQDRRLFAVYNGWKARQRRGCVRLQIDAEWAPVAWELLRDPDGPGIFLGMEEATPLEREVASTAAFPDPVEVEPSRLSVLAVGASPIHLPKLDLERERKLLGEVLSSSVKWVNEDEEELRRELRRPGAGYHVFHFAGHGSFDGKEGFVYIGDETTSPVSAGDLASMLLRCETLRLVVLNACEGAVAGSQADTVSIAEQLVKLGIPAVLAMQSPILDRTALQIVRDFYHALSQGRPVERAVNDLRLHLKRNQLEWAAPVLMMGNPRVPLFAVKQAAVATPQSAASQSAAPQSSAPQSAAPPAAEPQKEEPKKPEPPAAKPRLWPLAAAGALMIAAVAVAITSAVLLRTKEPVEKPQPTSAATAPTASPQASTAAPVAFSADAATSATSNPSSAPAASTSATSNPSSAPAASTAAKATGAGAVAAPSVKCIDRLNGGGPRSCAGCQNCKPAGPGLQKCESCQ